MPTSERWLALPIHVLARRSDDWSASGAGRLKTVAGLVGDITYSVRGQVATIGYGNGVTSTYGAACPRASETRPEERQSRLAHYADACDDRHDASGADLRPRPRRPHHGHRGCWSAERKLRLHLQSARRAARRRPRSIPVATASTRPIPTD
jgi:hypothetical protein